MSRCVVAASAALLIPFFSVAGASPVPMFGYAAPAAVDPAGVRETAKQCGIKDSVVFLPPVEVDLGAGGPAAALFESQRGWLRAGGPDVKAYLRLRLRVGVAPGQTAEQTIVDRIADLLKALPLQEPAVQGLMVETGENAGDPALVQFTLATLTLRAKASRSGLKVAFHYDSPILRKQGDLLRKAAIYADAIGTSRGPNWSDDLTWIAEQTLNKPVFLALDIAESDSTDQAAAAYMDAALGSIETAVEVLWVRTGSLPPVARACATSALLARHLKTGFAPMSLEVSSFTVTGEGGERGEQRAYSDSRTQDLVIVARLPATGAGSKVASLQGPATGEYAIEWHDPIRGDRLKPEQVRKTGAGTAQSCTLAGEYALLTVHKLGSQEDRVYTGVEVRDRAELHVEEIIARWQQYKESQRQLVENHVASCLMELHFESSGMGSGFDVAMQFKQFVNRGGLIEWVQTDFFVNGVKFRRNTQFPLPQIEPERVMTQPLELKLDEKYTYRLLGTEQAEGVACYVVGVEPAEQRETLYSGKIWIDATKFRQVKMELSQRGSDGNIVSNRETQIYHLLPDGQGHDINLLKSTYAHQRLNVAGRDFILQRTTKFSDYTINASDFDAQLKASRDSNNPMFRQTEQGLRSLRKEGAERVVDEKNRKRVRSLVGGLLYDGTFNFPIPIFGMSLVDFNFRNTNAQLSMFFAGPFFVSNLSREYHGKYRLGWDLAVSGLPGSSRVYVGNVENKKENLYIFEESTGLRATLHATKSVSFTGYSYFSYNFFRATSDTDKSFILPRNGVTINPGLEIKFAQKGYIFSADANQGRRIGWQPYGMAGTSTATAVNNNYLRYSLDAGKTFYLPKFMRTGLDFSGYGGDRLDRFSMYRPSFFSRPRVRGIPSGTDSFDTVLVGSAFYGFNVMEALKVEGYYNYARARNKFESRRFERFDGTEVNFGTAGPFGTFLQGTVTYALHGNLARYNSRFGVYFLIFKPIFR